MNTFGTLGVGKMRDNMDVIFRKNEAKTKNIAICDKCGFVRPARKRLCPSCLI